VARHHPRSGPSSGEPAAAPDGTPAQHSAAAPGTLEDRTLPSGGLIGSLVVFGDSLADTGNVSLATGGADPNSSIYYNGRYSNGPIWVDTLAKYMGAPAVEPSLAGGLDYAFGGATVAATFPAVPSVPQQVGLYLLGRTPAANDLFAVWAGANDFFDTLTSPTGPISPLQSADALAGSLNTIAAAGGREFVVANLPPLGETPFIRGSAFPASAGLRTSGRPPSTRSSVRTSGRFRRATRAPLSFPSMWQAWSRKPCCPAILSDSPTQLTRPGRWSPAVPYSLR
jgi:hypothetical protein